MDAVSLCCRNTSQTTEKVPVNEAMVKHEINAEHALWPGNVTNLKVD